MSKTIRAIGGPGSLTLRNRGAGGDRRRRIPTRLGIASDWVRYVVTRSLRTTTSPVTQDDADRRFLVESSGYTVTDYTIAFPEIRGAATRPVITHSNPAVATLDAAAGRLTYASDGVTTVTLTCNVFTQSFSLAFVSSQRRDQRTLVGGVPGSLRAAMSDAVDSRIVGRVPASAEPLFTSSVPGVSYTRNTGGVAADMDLSFRAVWHEWSAQWAGYAWTSATPFTPRHVLFVNHFWPNLGTKIRWLGSDGVLVERTLVNMYTPVAANVDLGVGVLDADLPATVARVRFLPADWAAYLPLGSAATPGVGVPVLYTNQFDKLAVAEIKSVASGGVGTGDPDDAYRALWHVEIVNHDSGQPVFTWLGGGPVLLGKVTSYGPYAVWVSSFLTQIDAAADALWPGPGANPYHLQTVDMTPYTRYS